MFTPTNELMTDVNIKQAVSLKYFKTFFLTTMAAGMFLFTSEWRTYLAKTVLV